MTDDEARRARYLQQMDKLRWVDVVETDFNRPPRMNEYGHLEWTARAFAFEDGTGGVKLAQTVFLHDGEGVEGGTPGVICIVVHIDPQVHIRTNTGSTWVSAWQYVRVKPIDWREDDSFT